MLRLSAAAARRLEGTNVVELTALVDCRSCGVIFDGWWVDDSLSVQDMADVPEDDQTCPACGNVQREPYPGWCFRGEAG